ncbi:hypothetical protein ACFX12_008199 [Malus domestica]
MATARTVGSRREMTEPMATRSNSGKSNDDGATHNKSNGKNGIGNSNCKNVGKSDGNGGANGDGAANGGNRDMSELKL